MKRVCTKNEKFIEKLKEENAILKQENQRLQAIVTNVLKFLSKHTSGGGMKIE